MEPEIRDGAPVQTESPAGTNVEPPADSHSNSEPATDSDTDWQPRTESHTDRDPTTDAGQPVFAANEAVLPDEVATASPAVHAAAGELQPTSQPGSRPKSPPNVEPPRNANAPASNDSPDVPSSRTQNAEEPQQAAPGRSNVQALPMISGGDDRPAVNRPAFAATTVSQTSSETVARAPDRPADDGELEAKPQPALRETSPRGSAELQPAESAPRLQNAENAGKPHAAAAVQQNAEDVATRFVQRIESALRQAVDQQRGFRVQLHPPELGALSVEIARGASGLAVRLVVDNADALQRVNESLAALQSSLKEQGMPVERIDVHLHRADDPGEDVPRHSADQHNDGRSPGDSREDRRRNDDSPFAADETESSDGRSARPPTHASDAIDVQI